MIKYNFIENYTSLKAWKPSKANIIAQDNNNEKEYLGNFITKYIYDFRKLTNYAKEKKILFIPSLSILSFTLIIEFFSIIPATNIRNLEVYHLDYEDRVSQLSDLNRELEMEFSSFLTYSNLYAIPAPDFLFAYYLQLAIPTNIQLSDYTIDKNGFKMNAIGGDMDTINKFLTYLLNSDLIKPDSLNLVRLVNQSTNQTDSFETSQNQSGIFVEITGKLSPRSLEKRIRLNKLAYNYGASAKLDEYLYILKLFKK